MNREANTRTVSYDGMYPLRSLCVTRVLSHHLYYKYNITPHLLVIFKTV